MPTFNDRWRFMGSRAQLAAYRMRVGSARGMRAWMAAGVGMLAIASTPVCADDSLYQALGGQAGLVRIVDGMMAHVLADPRTNPYFENASINRIKQKLVEQFCVLSGGPCTYTGRDMKRAHAGEKITAAAFNAAAEDLQKSMDENGIPRHTQDELIEKLTPMYGDIVEVP